MSVLAAFMVPHPPMIVPEIGRGSETKIAETIRSYEQVADEIAALKPDTILISSPHTVLYADYFHISPGSRAKGSFAQFRAPQVRFGEEYDEELAERICLEAAKEHFPAGVRGERDARLDHGVMVPLWFIRKRCPAGRIVRIGLSGLPGRTDTRRRVLRMTGGSWRTAAGATLESCWTMTRYSARRRRNAVIVPL